MLNSILVWLNIYPENELFLCERCAYFTMPNPEVENDGGSCFMEQGFDLVSRNSIFKGKTCGFEPTYIPCPDFIARVAKYS